jgi:hypothetical protein
MSERLAFIETMRTALLTLQRTEHGMLMHFQADPKLEKQLRAFAIDEKSCCQFWGFELTAGSEKLMLRWDAPVSAQPLIDRLEAFFRDKERSVGLDGLL